MKRCIHCHEVFYPRVPGESWPEADQCTCGRNDDGTVNDIYDDTEGDGE